jgi:3-hydroxyisobutyrate dehydrogenase
MARAAFIGLGVMGFPMAGHLRAKGHAVTVYNRSADKAARWCERFGGSRAATPREAASGAEIVFACVGNDDDLRSVALGEDGVLAGLDRGAVFVDHTTASADVARELSAACREQGRYFVDAPVSGGQQGAENGTLTVMCGGEPEAFAQAEPVMRAYGRAVTLIGPTGSGQLTKMVNQICIGGLVQALSEAINFAQRAGLDTHKVLATISKGAAQSWQMDNRWGQHGPGQVRLRLRGRLDAQGSLDRARRRPAQRRGSARDGARRPALPADPAEGWRPVRHLQPDPQPSRAPRRLTPPRRPPAVARCPRACAALCGRWGLTPYLNRADATLGSAARFLQACRRAGAGR